MVKVAVWLSYNHLQLTQLSEQLTITYSPLGAKDNLGDLK